MPLTVTYPAPPPPPPHPAAFAAIRAVAAQVRRQLPQTTGGPGLALEALLAASREVLVNGQRLSVSWECDRALHDEQGEPVLGLCHTDPEEPGWVYIAIDRRMALLQPELALSTAAHEFGHLLFDVPLAQDAGMGRYRAVARSAEALSRTGRGAEARANEFMGQLLTPPVVLHTRLLAHARNEGLRFCRGAHQGRPGSPILASGNPPDAMAGVLAALAGEFGVSERFIAVRLARYGLVQGGA